MIHNLIDNRIAILTMEAVFGDMTQIRYLHQDNLYQYQLLDPSGATSCTARIEISA